MCKRPSGCSVGRELKEIGNPYYDPDPLIQIGESIAADPEVNNFINEFVKAKVLYELNGIVEFQIETYKELGLNDEPGYLLELEKVYREGRNRQETDQAIPQPTTSRKNKGNTRGR